MDPLALLVSAVVLLAALAAAAAGSPRLPPGAVTVPGAAYLVLVGAVGYPEAESAVLQIAPAVGFLVVVLLLGHLADREGLFVWALAVTARRAGRSAQALFARTVVLAAVVTAVLSLHATLALLTPVVVATATRMRVPARPHADAAGHLANSASLLLPVSNLTNLLVFATTGLSFLRFSALMAGPWLVAVAVEYLLLRRLFRTDLQAAVGEPFTAAPRPPRLALAVIGMTVTGFAIASLVGLPPIWPALLGVAVLAGRGLVRRTSRPGELAGAANVPFALFVFGLAVVVLAVLRSGLQPLLAGLLPDGATFLPLLGMAVVAAVLATLLDNLPATLALLPVAAAGGAGPVLAVLVGVNVAPNLTHVGSLGTLLWRRALGVGAPPAGRFTPVGAATVPLTLVGATLALSTALAL